MKRSPELDQEYRDFLKTKPVPFEKNKVIENYGDWILVENDYPYDLLYKKHHLLIPRARVGSFTQLNKISQRRYHTLLAHLEDQYDLYFVNMAKGRTVPTHWHCHLAVWKK